MEGELRYISLHSSCECLESRTTRHASRAACRRCTTCRLVVELIEYCRNKERKDERRSPAGNHLIIYTMRHVCGVTPRFSRWVYIVSELSANCRVTGALLSCRVGKMPMNSCTIIPYMRKAVQNSTLESIPRNRQLSEFSSHST